MNNNDWSILKFYLIAHLVLTFVLCSVFICFAEDVNMDIIKQIESSGRADAVSFKGAKHGRGLYQISEVCLKEWNNFNPEETYTVEDLFDGVINLKIADWYMNKRIPQMLKHYEVEDTDENRLWAYNAGIGNVIKGIKPEETRLYIKKYYEQGDKYGYN
jgi:soluble lytic murein transglycosylase-like protein